MNNMKEVKIIQSKTEPNKNHLWLSDEGLKQFKGDGWEQVLSNDNGGSGGGSTDPNDENYVEYLDVSEVDIDDKIKSLIFYADMAKLTGEDIALGCQIAPLCLFILTVGSSVISLVKSFAIRPNKLLTKYASNIAPKQELCSFKEALILSEMWELYNSIPRITKEQFYNLNE